jgi:hypothetical protein
MHRCGSSGKCAVRREPNNHKAAKPRVSAAHRVVGCAATALPCQVTQYPGRAQAFRQLLAWCPVLHGSAALRGSGRGSSTAAVWSVPRPAATHAAVATLGAAGSGGNTSAAATSRLACFGANKRGILQASHSFSQLRAVLPNPSLEPTRYGRQRKPGLRHRVHHLSPGLRCLPPRSAQLER